MDKFKNIDILLTWYGDSGLYPQCFENLIYPEKVIDSEKEKIFFRSSFQFYQTL